MTAPPLAHRLAWLGSLPFVACAGLALGDGVAIGVSFDPRAVGNLYALLIVAFMAGAHWGQGLAAGAGAGLWLPSNALALAAFFAALLLVPALQSLVYAALFGVLLVIDYRAWRAGRIDRDYWNTRCRVSALVIGCLLVLALSD